MNTTQTLEIIQALAFEGRTDKEIRRALNAAGVSNVQYQRLRQNGALKQCRDKADQHGAKRLLVHSGDFKLHLITHNVNGDLTHFTSKIEVTENDDVLVTRPLKEDYNSIIDAQTLTARKFLDKPAPLLSSLLSGHL